MNNKDKTNINISNEMLKLKLKSLTNENTEDENFIKNLKEQLEKFEKQKIEKF